MPRQHEAFVDDIRESIDRIDDFTAGMDFEEFQDDQKTFDAVLFNLENIGEAVKNLPDDSRRILMLNGVI
ncbi:DUF86 domain-containing protein [Nanohaloarchaea archaeon H01]|nr:DUF86 domain-containing protein [Nanohaloarchaea archaeon H01]